MQLRHIPKLNYKETKRDGKYEKSERGVWDTMERSIFFSFRVLKEEVRKNEASEYLKKQRLRIFQSDEKY